VSDLVYDVRELGFVWHTFDPFLFCVHHLDHYPEGTEAMGPDPALLRGRRMGMDFETKDGFRMYHGQVVPGFPRHPHRGFETLTLARDGFIDHSDSLGATARFGHGDAQWMTAGSGIVHSEMFPMVNRDAPNPTEMFQIWINLPAIDKMVPAHFSMLWKEAIPRLAATDEHGRRTDVTIVAGSIGDLVAPPPPPNSWASKADGAVAVWMVAMEPNAEWTLPAGPAGVNRTIYFFDGQSLRLHTTKLPPGVGARVAPEAALSVRNGSKPGQFVMLQGRPIGEPVVHHGPFVMNRPHQINQAIADYRRTGYGGWPWSADGPVHAREEGRFAKHADGQIDRPE
jgi:redox-sensitive bicupin YhaK (pirin superfamily)